MCFVKCTARRALAAGDREIERGRKLHYVCLISEILDISLEMKCFNIIKVCHYCVSKLGNV